ncbi:DMT family transporter [Staphylococcus massiliensis]|uniref:Small multi drug resistance protein n=1 Tax=Staphylococcus massiliensis S46 TaxID=1229783 RepID=K9B2G9_9STAP|nr:multidrug efflux SMR transporter [Staphylococcus massiliensis]EKU48977.1 small multi drug resistance protein [Staphylococcus massiliensis S46]MCG3399417.1 multidrug efflux SMR transporter [Staphylococcus massiliensis]MCG3402483.1 multidrug efflux SMR transporter [Staphylococcus massiliensis]MCG3411553.1 multidrug efflux SMR transporter [Staphylococcus massiliensis]PNZ98712.1 QacE family quaternary ammonium compound efflux SMR transporter [Staphylococcus massiliensis CCUG 55927]
MYWGLLVLAGCFEILGVYWLNKIAQSSNKIYVILLGVTFFCSFSILALAMKGIPMGTAYAVWTGIGTAGGTIIGMIWYNESKKPMRILCIFLIIVAVIGLKLMS